MPTKMVLARVGYSVDASTPGSADTTTGGGPGAGRDHRPVLPTAPDQARADPQAYVAAARGGASGDGSLDLVDYPVVDTPDAP